MKAINLPSPITYVTQAQLVQFGEIVQEELTNTLSGLTLRELIDNPGARTVTARFLEPLPDLTLWEGDAYDTVGDWTQGQAEDRIIEILTTP